MELAIIIICVERAMAMYAGKKEVSDTRGLLRSRRRGLRGMHGESHAY